MDILYELNKISALATLCGGRPLKYEIEARLVKKSTNYSMYLVYLHCTWKDKMFFFGWLDIYSTAANVHGTTQYKVCIL